MSKKCQKGIFRVAPEGGGGQEPVTKRHYAIWRHSDEPSP